MAFNPSSRGRLRAAASMLAALGAMPAHGAVDPAAAVAVFREAATLCERDAGALWGHSLCGPMLLVDPADGTLVANRADAGGVLKPSGAVFAGVLPNDAMVANSPLDWSGTHWTELLWPLPDDEAQRHVMLAHELFHRIQPELGLPQSDSGNQHLDTLEGRYLLQLEWRALAKALRAPDAGARDAAVADALLFRRERHRLFETAAAEEGALELHEGVSEYTGVRVGLATPEARVAYALRDLAAFVPAPTFVRSFAYATGPAYGLLLDQADPAWRTKVRSGQRLDQLLAAALRLPAATPSDVAARAAAYDDGTLRAAELRRDEQTRAHLAALKARFVDGPVLSLPLSKASFQFNPQTLQALGQLGSVYPTLRLVAPWGELEVDGGALMDKAMKTATVSAAGVAPSDTKGPGWRLALKAGWSLQPGARKGDLVLHGPAGGAP